MESKGMPEVEKGQGLRYRLLHDDMTHGPYY